MTEVVIRNVDEALAEIGRLMELTATTGEALEDKGLEIGLEWYIGEDWIRSGFIEARNSFKEKLDDEAKRRERLRLVAPARLALKERKQEEAAASLKKPDVQPSIEESNDSTQGDAKPFVRRSFRSRKVAVSSLNKSPVIRWPDEWPEAPLPPSDATAFEKLLYPRGLLGHATQYVVDTSGLPDRKLALGVSLSALAKGMDRKVIGPSGNSVILFILLIAETGAGKQHGLDCVRGLLRAMGLEACYAAGGLASVQAIEEIIEGIKDKIEANPNALVVIDEVGGWLSRILAKGQGGNVSEIPIHLQTLWGLTADGIWTGTKKVGKEMSAWYSVAFAILGFSTEKMFFRALKDKLIGSGFVNRMMMFDVGRGASERVDPKYSWTQCPKWLVDALRLVTNLDEAPFHSPMKLSIPTVDGDDVGRDFHHLGWGPGVKEACRAFEKDIRGMPSREDRELWIRTHDIAVRLATIHAFYRCSRTVEMVDWQWAEEIARYSTEQLKLGVDKHMLEELEDADLAEQIRDYFRERKNRAIPIGEVSKRFERKANVKKLNEVIWHVERTRDIIVVEMPPGPGRPTVHFKWNRK